MILRLIIFWLVLFGALNSSAQIEDENRNALPPGPARISGFVMMDSLPVKNAVLRVEYLLDGQTTIRNFKTFGGGEYTVYINPKAKDPVITVDIDGKEMFRFSPDYWYEGSVQRKNLHIPR